MTWFRFCLGSSDDEVVAVTVDSAGEASLFWGLSVPLPPEAAAPVVCEDSISVPVSIQIERFLAGLGSPVSIQRP